MNMKSSNNTEEIKNKFKSLLVEKDEKEGVDHDAYMLMAGYLSEIERVQEETKLKRNALASKIGITPSYLTQVFRGDKPLNFHTLAKIKRALKIKFFVRAFYENQNSKTETKMNMEPFSPDSNKFVSIFLKVLKGDATHKEIEFAVQYAMEYEIRGSQWPYMHIDLQPTAYV